MEFFCEHLPIATYTSEPKSLTAVEEVKQCRGLQLIYWTNLNLHKYTYHHY